MVKMIATKEGLTEMKATEYTTTPQRIQTSIAERANALGLQVIMLTTVQHRVPTYLFYRDGAPLGYVQSNALAWLAGYAAGELHELRRGRVG